MMAYVFSLGAGIVVGVIYHFMGVRSPAPPLVALAGLLGILIGEEAVPLIKERLLSSKTPPKVEGAVTAAAVDGYRESENQP